MLTFYSQFLLRAVSSASGFVLYLFDTVCYLILDLRLCSDLSVGILIDAQKMAQRTTRFEEPCSILVYAPGAGGQIRTRRTRTCSLSSSSAKTSSSASARFSSGRTYIFHTWWIRHGSGCGRALADKYRAQNRLHFGVGLGSTSVLIVWCI